MQIKLNWRFLIAFGALIILLKEIHELSHILSGYLFFGCWGPYRDFNVISICAAGAEDTLFTLIAGINGPLFSYACMWIGLGLLLIKDQNKRWLGFALLFASKPFARFFTVLTNGGDELGVLRVIFSSVATPLLTQLIGIVLILCLILPPLWIAYNRILNKRKAWWFAAFLIVPMLFDFVVLHTFLNGILKAGILDTPYLFATPILIQIVFLVALLIFLLLRKAVTHYPKEFTQDFTSIGPIVTTN